MYPVSDDDLELLECYLDDALSDAEITQLRMRLATDSDLATSLRMLHEERSQRQAFFQTIEPTPSDVEILVASIHEAAHRRRWWQDARRLTRYGSAVAACMVMALLGGFFYHASDKAPLRSDELSGKTPTGVVTPVRYPVEVRDENDHVIAVQHFDNPSEADEFARDVKQMQERRRQSNVMFISNHDF